MTRWWIYAVLPALVLQTYLILLEMIKADDVYVNYIANKLA